MKRPKWSARLLYIAVALALVIGLTPMAVFAGYASIVIDGPNYAKEMQTITFTAETNPTADPITWTMPGDWAGPTSGPSITGHFATGSAGVHTISAVGTWGSLTQTAYVDIKIGVGLIPQLEYNIIGSQATFCVPDQYAGLVLQWRFSGYFPDATGLGFMVVSGGLPREGMTGGPDDCVTLQSDNWGEVVIYADIDDGDGEIETTLRAYKKWGKIYDTWLHWKDKDGTRHYTPGSTEIVWNSNEQKYVGSAYLCDFVVGEFITNGGREYPALADGADVQWWVMDARAPVDELPSSALQADLVEAVNDMQDRWPSQHVGFRLLDSDENNSSNSNPNNGNPCDTKYLQTVTTNGEVCVELVACGQEAVKIVVVAKYPDGLHQTQWLVFPQILSWNFWKQQVEKVPQVAWAGEKVVLEKQFGQSYETKYVLFGLENQSVGTLVPVDPGAYSPDGGNTVWTYVNEEGVARVIIESESQGAAHVKASLYVDEYAPKMQHGFEVYYLAFAGLSLSNVVGERDGHDDGLFVPENPWDVRLDEDTDTTNANVSQDTLLRARVEGYFLDPRNLSWRETEVRDIGGTRVRLPEGHWLLPEDWPELAGGLRNWQNMAPHWDIMTQPSDNVMSLGDPLGDYHEWDLTGTYLDRELAPVAEAPVIGPYSTLDTYMPEVYYKLVDREPVPVVRGVDEETGRKTIVPNAKLNWWDCPMPPAKIGFVIEEGPGYFKAADKADIYYKWLRTGYDPDLPDYRTIAYTNPFYQMMIPASPSIPPFLSSGGYDWDSFGFEGREWGPYPFWEFINTYPRSDKELATGFVEIHNDPQHPTWVWVYSDNHGEAMVWLNGDWNLDLQVYSGVQEAPHDIPTGTEVGDTTVVAVADYPYLRPPRHVWSNEVEKTWEWGVDILGADPHDYWDGTQETDTRMVIQVRETDAITGKGQYKMVFLWVADRDGQPVEGARIDWSIASLGNGATIPDFTGNPSLHPNLPDLRATDGFLRNVEQPGEITDDPTRKRGTSYTRMPDSAELYLFNKLWGPTTPSDIEWNHGVAGVMVHAVSPILADVTAVIHLPEGKITRTWNLDFDFADPQNPHRVEFLLGDANNDGVVDAGDITMIKRIFFGMETCYNRRWMADVNGDDKVDSGDITALKNILFGTSG